MPSEQRVKTKTPSGDCAQRAPTILTVDVEDWYHLNYSSMSVHRHTTFESRVELNTLSLIEHLRRLRAKATFFFLGSVAEQFPHLVSTALFDGHEIASHGYSHELVYQQCRQEFYDDVKRSLDVLQNITGRAVLGYRAPSWSFSDAVPWTAEVLAGLGLKYSSSVFPVKTYLYGDGGAPVAPFMVRCMGGEIQEVPATVLRLGRLRMPFGGGFYLRIFPYWLTRLAVCLTHQQHRPVMLYVHPREIDPSQPRLSLGCLDYAVTYMNLRTTLPKLRRLLTRFPTTSVSDYLGLMEV